MTKITPQTLGFTAVPFRDWIATNRDVIAARPNAGVV
jgi:hypothetical protein